MTLSKRDPGQVLKASFDDDTQSLRTTVVNIVENPDGVTEVSINDADDSIKIGDGNQHYASVNNDGSFNVSIVNGSQTTFTPKNVFNEILSVASGITTILVTYTVPSLTKAIFQIVDVSGENIAQYDAYVNSDKVDTKRTYFGGGLNANFSFIAGENEGLMLIAGDEVIVQVTHNRPDLANFNGRIQVLEYE